MEDHFRHCAALVREADRDRYLATLFGVCIKVTLGAVAVIALVAIYYDFDKTNRAVLLTVLIVSVLYLTARVARSRQTRDPRREAGR